ncbi:hypothetical protein NFI96_002512 [Prochilodus magdalenae]|nr:hypothetical protein NFI96_002512 [Prochilodus magdalenae]
MEDEWEEEEQLVVAELSGMIDSAVLRRCDGWCKVVGLDSEQPVLQLGRYVFAGEYEDAVGTCVIFQEDSGDGLGSSGSPSLRYQCHTAKKLMLQRTFLSERKEGESCSGGIEVLSLNEGDVCGRASTVCHYVLDPTELERVKAEQGRGMSEESDTETMERGETSTRQDSMLDGGEAAENDSHTSDGNMTKAASKKRAESDAATRRSRPAANGRPGKVLGGRGLGKAGAKRLGKMLKRVIQDERNGKGKGTDQLPTTPIRLLKHKAQASGGGTWKTTPQVSDFMMKVISQCKCQGGMSMEELKKALAAGGYDVTKNNTRVKMAMRGLKRNNEKSGRTRAKREKDAKKTSASNRPKPTGKYDKVRQKQQQKRARPAVQNKKTVQKGGKAQSRARKNTKKTKAATKTKPYTHRKQHSSLNQTKENLSN